MNRSFQKAGDARRAFPAPAGRPGLCRRAGTLFCACLSLLPGWAASAQDAFDFHAGPPWARTWCAYARAAYWNGTDSDWDGLTDDEETLRLALWGEVEPEGLAWVAEGSGAAVLEEWTWCGVDDDVQPVDLPFGFPWGPVVETRVWIGVNGTLGFGRGQSSAQARALPAVEAGPHPFFAVYWRQLYLESAAGGRVWTQSPDADRFVVTWENLQVGGIPDSRLTFQAELHRDGGMIWRYRDLEMGAGGESGGVIGAQRGGRGWWCSAADLAPGTALRIVPLPAISPLSADSDGDGIADGIEFHYLPLSFSGGFSLDPLRPDPADLDRDGLDVTGEYLHGRLNPFHWDTDGDLLGDGYEVAVRLLAYDAAGIHGPDGDADGDGFSNGMERLHRCQPRLADSDGDGLSDRYEAIRGSNPAGLELPPPSTFWLAPVRLRLGDPGFDGGTEAYELRIDPVSGDSRGFTFQNTAYGTVQTQAVQLVIGARYRVSVRHLGSHPSRNLVADPDYEAGIEGIDGTSLEVTDPTGLLGMHASATPVPPGEEPIDTNREATVWIQSRMQPDGTAPVFDPQLLPQAVAWRAGRAAGSAAVPTGELQDPGVLVLPATYAPALGGALPARIRAQGHAGVAGMTRWLRFSAPSRITLQRVGGSLLAPPPAEVRIDGATTADVDFDLRVNGAWPAGTTVRVDYLFRSASGNLLSATSLRLLGQTVFAVGDSMTYGYRRRRDGTKETPNWGNPWLIYPSPSSWDGYYGNWSDINFQGIRGFLRRDLAPGIPWVGHNANGHGPDHCGYSGSRTYHINGTLGDTSRAYPRNAVLSGPSHTVVIYWIGLNDTSSGDSASVIFDRWKAGLGRILALRSGRGRTLIVGVTLPRIRSDYAGYSSSRQAKQDVVNSWIRGYTLSAPQVRYVVANIEGVPHDSNDDGLHFMATGYGRVAQIVLQAIYSGVRAGP